MRLHRSVVAGLVLFFFLLTGCQTNKYIPANEYLLSQVNIQTDKKTIDKNALRSYQKQKPNTKIFGFWRFHLGLYNLSSKKKENDWLKRIGEAPVIYDPFLTQKTKEEFSRYLQNKGYYNAVIRDSTLLRSNRKAEVNYYITTNQPYMIKTYQTVIRDDSLRPFLAKKDDESLIMPNSLFDSDLLGSESGRLLRKLQNNGYFKSTKNSFYYEADSIGKDHGVDLKLVVEKDSYLDSTNQIIPRNYEKFAFRNFYYINEKDIQNSALSGKGNIEEDTKDTLKMGRHFFIYKGRKKLRPDLMINANHLADSRLGRGLFRSAHRPLHG